MATSQLTQVWKLRNTNDGIYKAVMHKGTFGKASTVLHAVKDFMGQTD